MNQSHFSALLPFISTDLISFISEKQKITVDEAISKLYSSKLYEMLEDEETKVWYYSTPMLFSLYEQEETTGKIKFPDE